MLALTDNAALAIREIVSASDIPDSGGLRISTAEGQQGRTDFKLALAEAPDDADEVVPATEASVFLSPEAAPLLEDQVLDADITNEGVSFRLRRQETPGS